MKLLNAFTDKFLEEFMEYLLETKYEGTSAKFLTVTSGGILEDTLRYLYKRGLQPDTGPCLNI